MKKYLSVILAIIAWFAVLTQYYLMIENRVTSISETTIRFFSFFTILTNAMVAFYYTVAIIKPTTAIIQKAGTVTAITVYITVVGLVYQIVLRPLWHPEGLQKIVDELLHAVVPLMVIMYWYLYEQKSSVNYKQIPKWLIYPLLYLIYILIRGALSGFYPYPFMHVQKIGLLKVLINSFFLLILFSGLSAIFIRAGKFIKYK